MKVPTVWIVIVGENPILATLTSDKAKEMVRKFEEEDWWKQIYDTNVLLGIDTSDYEHRIVEIPLMLHGQGVDLQKLISLDD